MAAKALTANEMAHVTAGMLNPESPANSIITGNQLMAPLTGVLNAAHVGLISVLPKADDPRLAQVVAESMQVDAVHDGLVSGSYNLLTALSLLNDNSVRYLETRDYLFPEGIAAATNITYEGQAGYAKRLRPRLTEERQAALAEIPAGSRNLLEVVLDWLDAGDRLAALTEEKQQLKDQNQMAPVGVVYEARLAWIQAINALRSMADLAKLSPEQYRTVFSVLDELEAKGDERTARRRARQLEEDIEAEVAESLSSVRPPAA